MYRVAVHGSIKEIIAAEATLTQYLRKRTLSCSKKPFPIRVNNAMSTHARFARIRTDSPVRLRNYRVKAHNTLRQLVSPLDASLTL